MWVTPCITCGRKIVFRDSGGRFSADIQAGHFQSRSHPVTRYNDENVNAQCIGCNRFKQGEQFKHGQEIDLKYGDGTAKKLQKLAKEEHRFTREELEQVIKEAKEQIAFYEQL